MFFVKKEKQISNSIAYCYNYSQLAAYVESKCSLGTSLRQLIQTSDVSACCPELPGTGR